MKPHNRLAVIALAISTSLSGLATPLVADEAAKEQTGYTIGLSMYSLRQLFRDGSLKPLDYPAFAKKTFGITEIDIWDGGFPEDKRNDLEFYKELKKRSDAAGTHIFLVMAGAVDATGETPEQRKKGGDAHRKYVDHAAILGSKFVRVFLKAPEGGKRKVAIAHSIEALTPLADYAREKGVMLVIEPGASKWARNGHFLAALAKTMDHPACRLMPDFGKLADPYCGTVAMLPYSESVSAKSWGFDEEGNEKSLSYFRLIRSLHDVHYNKIVSIEYEGEKLDPVAGVKATQKLLQRMNKK
ncbi:MAG: sugar phosphate isomerase/epimerase [Verrucomicrobiae bacterium]|nr:sugar phosphate isomerase/epimerase [Verrucomicrobiae bacterium]NNJ86338.1 sugar phosphate isomerase/epimerase [Akkermansiaceae bacterium]